MELQDQSEACYQDKHNLLCLPIFSQFVFNKHFSDCCKPLVNSYSSEKEDSPKCTSVLIMFMDKEFCEVFMLSFLLMCPDLLEVLVGERAFNKLFHTF